MLVGSTPTSGEVDAVGTAIAGVGSAGEVPAPFQPFHVARHRGARGGHPPAELRRGDARGGGEHGVDRELVACHAGRPTTVSRRSLVDRETSHTMNNGLTPCSSISVPDRP